MTKPGSGIENTFVVPAGCNAAEAVKTTVNGCGSSKSCFLLEKLRKKSNNVEFSFLGDGKYAVNCNGREGIIDVPQEITTLGLMLMMEYLNRSAIVCNTCKVCLEKGKCPRTLFV